MFRGCEPGDSIGSVRCPGHALLSGVNFTHAPHEHRSLLVEIDGAAKKGLASPAVLILLFFRVALQAKLDQPVH